MPKDTIDRDRGIDFCGSPEAGKLDVITRADDFPELDQPQLLDLHAAHVQLESLPFERRLSAKRHLHRIGSAAGASLRSEMFADLIRQAIELANSGNSLE